VYVGVRATIEAFDPNGTQIWSYPVVYTPIEVYIPETLSFMTVMIVSGIILVVILLSFKGYKYYSQYHVIR